MCRIAGIIKPNFPEAKEKLLAMRDSMKHGGPDDAGFYNDVEAGVYLAHRRLSLIDLSDAGHQPMYADNENLIIVYNGEIYNFKEIQKELVQLGYVFTSQSDTEVILYSFLAWGTKCFDRFNGMFALVLYDKKNAKIYLARDHAGIKPLYYAFKNNSLIFASETKAFKVVDTAWNENPEWRTFLLTFGHMPEPFTTLQQVFSLPKGSFMEVDISNLKTQLHQFYNAKYNYTIFSEEQATQSIKASLQQSVEQHLISDAPIGLFLSGGIDSSILTILAKKFSGQNLHTLSIDFDQANFSEKKYQDIIIQQTAAKHKRYTVKQEDFEAAVEDILLAMDQPSNDGVNTYFITKYAQKAGLKAVLSGVGADELLGGYPSFKRSTYLRKSTFVPTFLLHLAEHFADDKKRKIRFLERKNALGHYLFNRGFFTPVQVAGILGISEQEVKSTIDSVALPDWVAQLNKKEQVSFTELNLYMQNQLLRDTDYMSMWHSVEVRVPFLDKDFISTCHSIHPSIKFGSTPKQLLIKAFSDVLPEEIWNRPKQGFIFPFGHWLQSAKLPFQQNKSLEILQHQLSNGKTHWSRYWTYYLASKQKTQTTSW